MSIEQMSLQLSFESAMGRDDFFRGPSNEAALGMIECWPDWPSHWLLLAGPVGTGKSHLARIWQERSGARILTLSDLNKSDPTQLFGSGAVVLEDADGALRDDTMLFHFLNAAKEAEAYVLITSRSWPESWGVGLPDLASRLRLTTPVELFEPDDTLLRAVLGKLFADRQLFPEKVVLDYIVLRMERSVGAALRIVDAIDKAALAQQRTITRPLAAAVLRDLDDRPLV
jgi:chromosomal replication initiation ATPase DnaA